MGFTHLHVHGEYSLLDGLAGAKELIGAAKELGMTSLALTDHGNLFGAVDFYNAALKRDGDGIVFDEGGYPEFTVKPIIGCEIYLAARTRFDKDKNLDGPQSLTHLILLVKDETGYRNLSQIVSNSHLEGFYYKPRTDMDDLRAHSSGLIALSGCIQGAIQESLISSDYAGAKEKALELFEIFGEGNFYLEIQDQDLEEERFIRADLIRLSRETGIPLAATNDIHYLKREDADVHDVLLCVQTGKLISDPGRMRFPNDMFYMRSEAEMRGLFADIPEALDNTEIIAAKCDFHFDLKSVAADREKRSLGVNAGTRTERAARDYFPEFPPQDGLDNEKLLRSLCEEGMVYRYGEKAESYRDRLEYELSVIRQMDFADYFLIVWDFIRFAREHGIAVGPGRGSAAGSIVSYALRITDIDPMKYGLLFERFLNPERKSMPDIDVDFCINRRAEVVDYVREKYGQENVANIITFNTLKARAAIRAVGRALALPIPDVNRLINALPEKAQKLDEAYSGTSKDAEENIIEFKEESARFLKTVETVFTPAKVKDKAPQPPTDYRQLMKYARALEKKPSYPGTHAAGVVISREKLNGAIPLSLTKGEGAGLEEGKSVQYTSVQYTMNTVEDLGFLKMDLLGLRNLTLIDHAIRMIEENRGIIIDIDSLSFDDPKVYALIASGKTEGVFQLENRGMKDFMRQLKPNCFEDIIIGISMYRPGPMKDIPLYLRNKKAPDAITYMHPLLVPILAETYGVMVYQEQVMRIVRDLGGFSFSESDEVRRSMSKKKADTMIKTRKDFVSGCGTNAIPDDVANRIFDHMVSFASYAFNKSHAAVYAVIAYQTAFLKTYYKEEYMASLMSSVTDSQDKVLRYIYSARDMGIPILPPDILRSHKNFSVSGDAIVMGLDAIKNVGVKAIDSIIEAREQGLVTDIRSLMTSVDKRVVNKRAMESLIYAGAMDSLCPNRAQAMQEFLVLYESESYKALIPGQVSIFETTAVSVSQVSEPFSFAQDYPPDERMEKEKEALGMYLSAHPLDSVKWIIDKIGAVDTYRLKHPGETGGNEEDEDDEGYAVSQNTPVILAGLLSDVRRIVVQKGKHKGKTMAVLRVEDFYGDIEVVVYSEAYEKCKTLLDPPPAPENEGSAETGEPTAGVTTAADVKNRIVVARGTVTYRDGKTPSIRATRITPIETVEAFFLKQDREAAETSLGKDGEQK